MLEKIPGFNRSNSPSEKNQVTVDLAAITYVPSRVLCYAECTIYSAMAISASIAIFPFFNTEFYWPLLWLVFIFSIVMVIRQRLKTGWAAAVTLDIHIGNWRLRCNGVDTDVRPFDDVLLWSWVIILPLKETDTGKKHRIVLLQDSVNSDDWRRLRVWLRTCFSR